VYLGSIIDSSEKIGSEYWFLEFMFESAIEFFVIIPDFVLLSLTNLNRLLKAASCFLKVSIEEEFCFIKKYSSCKDELYGVSQKTSSSDSIEAQFLKSYSAYSVKKGK
jgi:hypothetical protein